jgi:hypothetical protein
MALKRPKRKESLARDIYVSMVLNCCGSRLKLDGLMVTDTWLAEYSMGSIDIGLNISI